jgi:hypothetical protein
MIRTISFYFSITNLKIKIKYISIIKKTIFVHLNVSCKRKFLCRFDLLNLANCTYDNLTTKRTVVAI